jgi:hypothetical protein
VAAVASPATAGSDGDVANQTGDDITQPLEKIELLDRFTTAPGPGGVEGTAKQVDTNTPFARFEAPFQIAPQWELAFRVEIPMVSTNGVTPENPSGQVVTGFGNVLTQGWLVYQIDPRWAVAAGAQAIAPTSTKRRRVRRMGRSHWRGGSRHAPGSERGQLLRAPGPIRRRFWRQRRRTHAPTAPPYADP